MVRETAPAVRRCAAVGGFIRTFRRRDTAPVLVEVPVACVFVAPYASLGAWLALTAIAACSATEAPTGAGTALVASPEADGDASVGTTSGPGTGDGQVAPAAWVPRANYKARLEPDDRVLHIAGQTDAESMAGYASAPSSRGTDPRSS